MNQLQYLLNVLYAVKDGKDNTNNIIIYTRIYYSNLEMEQTRIKVDNIDNINNNYMSWPALIILILGFIIVVYIAVGPNIAHDRRLFGIILISLWTILWFIILWIVWSEYKSANKAKAWWLLFIPIITILMFFILIILMDFGRIQ